jgi:hypothetical protein
MTPEQPNPLNERVTRLEANLDRFIDFVLQNQRDQQLQLRSQQAQIDTLAEGQRGLTEAVQDLVTLQREVITRIDEMQSEIRGLQTENRRILDRLFNQEPPEPDAG